MTYKVSIQKKGIRRSLLVELELTNDLHHYVVNSEDSKVVIRSI